MPGVRHIAAEGTRQAAAAGRHREPDQASAVWALAAEALAGALEALATRQGALRGAGRQAVVCVCD